MDPSDGDDAVSLSARKCLLVGIIGPLLGVMTGLGWFSELDSPTVYLAGSMLLVIGVPVWRGWRQGFDPFDPLNFIAVLFLVTHLSFPLVIWVSRDFGLSVLTSGYVDVSLFENLELRHFTAALRYVFLGVVFLFAGYTLPLGDWLLGYVPTTWEGTSDRRLRSFIMILFGVCGCLLFTLFVFELGSIQGYLDMFLRQRGTFITGKGYYWLGFFLLHCCPPMLVLYAHQFHGDRITPSVRGVMAITVIVGALGTGRGSLLLPLLSFVIARHYLVRRLSANVVALSVVAFMILVVGGAELRNFGQYPEGYERPALVDAVSGSFFADIELFGLLLWTVTNIPEVHSFYFGLTLLDIPLFFVPRVLFPGKATFLGTSRLEADLLPFVLEAGTNVGFSAIGDLYANFGVMGIVAGMFVFGVFCRMLYGWLLRSDYALVPLGCFACGWWFLLLFFRGGFYLFFINFLTIAALYAACGWWTGIAPRRRLTPAPVS